MNKILTVHRAGLLLFASSASVSLAVAATTATPRPPESAVPAPSCGASCPSGSAPVNSATRARIKPARPTAAPVPLQYLDSKLLTLPVGAIHLLPVKGKVVRVALGSGSVISTTAVDDRLLLIAEQPGITSLMVWTDQVVHSLRVEVVPKDLDDVRTKIEAFTAGLPGVTVTRLGSEFVVSGTAHREAVARLNATLKGVPGVTLNLAEDSGPPFARSVLFRLHFIEVKKSLIEKIGIDWAKDAQGPVFGATGVLKDTGIYEGSRQAKEGDNLLSNSPEFVSRGTRQGGVFFGLATTIASRINLGISDGDIRVLASPELTAKSGGTAKLQVGGEVPIPVAAGLGAVNVVFKPYGVLFAIEPRIDANDVITAKVSTELSQIDPSVTVGGIPGFLSRTTSTEVSLKPGEMVALSGLLMSEMSNAVDRVPGLGTVPVLGRLFKSEDFRDRKTELVVLLEPEIISAGDGLAQQLRARGQSNIKEFDDKVKERNRKPAALPAESRTPAGEFP